MAVNNSIANRQPKQLPPEKPVEYRVNDEIVRLTSNMVRDYLTSGNGNVTDAEVAFFINMCKYQKLNPLTKDAYLVKYGSQPAAIIVGKDALLKRAMHNPKYAGHQAGVIVRTEDGSIEYRTGSLILEREKLAGGWAKVFVKGYEVPIEAAVSLSEYLGTKSDGSTNSMWSGKPATMIRKVALVTGLREAFPDDLSGLYASEEIVGEELNEPDMPPIIEEEPTNAPPELPEQLDQVPQQTTIEELQDF